MTNDIATASPEDRLGLSSSLLGSIGLFVVAYADLEHAIHAVAYRYIGLGEEPCRALIAGARLGDVMGSTKRLIIAKELDQQIYDDLEVLFGEVKDMATFRDMVVHRQWDGDSNGAVLSNLIGAKSAASLEKKPVSTEELRKSTHACLALTARLFSHLLTREEWENVDTLQIPPDKRALFRCPWFDKLGPPATPCQPSQKASQSIPRRQI